LNPSSLPLVQLIDTLTNWGELLIREEYYDGYFHNHDQSHKLITTTTTTTNNNNSSNYSDYFNNNNNIITNNIITNNDEIIMNDINDYSNNNNNVDDNDNNHVSNYNGNDNNGNDRKKVSTIVNIIPYEGFVIKIFQINNNQKAFINVFHHTIVKDNQLLLCYDPYNTTSTTTNNDGNNDGNNDDNTIKNIISIFPIVYISINDILMLDKNNKEAIVYNILVSSSYFMTEINLKLKTKIGDNSSINKVILFCYYSYYYLSY